jgi:hypothetical protein
MAKMKGEVLQMYYDEHGAKLRDRFIKILQKLHLDFLAYYRSP